jgi:hypothetical protein
MYAGEYIADDYNNKSKNGKSTGKYAVTAKGKRYNARFHRYLSEVKMYKK